MKLQLHEKHLIVLGCTHEENDWGHYQFPHIYRMPDDGLCVFVHMAEDNERAYGEPKDCFVSYDEGTTWTRRKGVEPPHGVQLADGRWLNSVDRPSVDISYMEKTSLFTGLYGFLPDMPLAHAEKSNDQNRLPTTMYEQDTCYGHFLKYHMDTLPDELQDFTFRFRVTDPETGAAEEYDAPLDWPNMPAVVYEYENGEKRLVKPSLYGQLKRAPDGSVWAIHYAHGSDPVTGGLSPYSAAYIFRSTDEGKSFKVHAQIPYIPDTSLDPLAFYREGFPEPDVEFMPDGSVIMVMRTCGVGNYGPNFGPLFFTRSTDGGVTWDKPRVFDKSGVLPQLRRLDCGVTLAIYGRPGIFVRMTTDPSGQVWDDPVEVMTPESRAHLANDPQNKSNHPFHRWEGSCCNVHAAVLDDHRIIITYSDFYIPDENGVKRKGCYSQIVEVVQD